jgi:hypothetical protein
VLRYRQGTNKVLGEEVLECATMCNNNAQNMQTCEVVVKTSACCTVSLEKPVLTQLVKKLTSCI